jgi:hypothetical protein
MKRTVFFISDGTGITAETLGLSLLTQFECIEFDRITLPYIDTVEKARQVVIEISESFKADGNRPIIFDTVVDKEVRQIFRDCEGFMVDIFSTFVSPLEKELGMDSSYTVGKSHSIDVNDRYPLRIAAVHFALDNDDGGFKCDYANADIILTGVSRTGKTPTCLYLALQFGIKAANYPMTEDDLEELQIPKVLRPHKDKLFGLTIDPQRLGSIRQERQPDSRYASARQCQMEVREVEGIFRRCNVPFLNTTDLSIEEISSRILAAKGIQRRT